MNDESPENIAEKEEMHVFCQPVNTITFFSTGRATERLFSRWLKWRLDFSFHSAAVHNSTWVQADFTVSRVDRLRYEKRPAQP